MRERSQPLLIAGLVALGVHGGLWLAIRGLRLPDAGPPPVTLVDLVEPPAPAPAAIPEPPDRAQSQPARGGSPVVQSPHRAERAPSPQPAPASTETPAPSPSPAAANVPLDLTGDAYVVAVAGRGAPGAGGTATGDGHGDGRGAGGGRRGAGGPSSPRAPAAAPDRASPVSLADDSWSCPWPRQADAEQIDEQTVVIRAVVAADGTVESVELVSDPGHGFGPAAAACALRTRFTPARDRAGDPVRSRSPPIEVRFTR